MRKICLTMPGLIVASAAYACPVCGENQPKPLRGITHRAGPESRWDYVIIGNGGHSAADAVFLGQMADPSR
ncbi:hypothetical protein [Dyadobacter fermentans]|nr:hypothetical protein [Dyadobacter fermentans]